MAHTFLLSSYLATSPLPSSLLRQPVPASLEKKDYEKDKGSQVRREQKSVASQFSSLYTSYILHCKEIRIHVFPEKELRGLSPYFHIHGVSERSIYSHVQPTYFPAAE
jgi:hypothetical protein